ncbi:MAG: AraC family transcriptional regulator, partial [Mesorhizobium sp.]
MPLVEQRSPLACRTIGVYICPMPDHSSRSSSAPHIPMDALSEVLQDFRLSGVNYGRC